ncbi:hypothetical protein SSP531S_54110 [Streptomyces spongiicola]|uniref:Uncharacterized protein n=1 Tax=Streptomyces spongiicola TaxID=1690221 RepID=A0A388T6R6_9ACTN|nr:hypothetical protein [Streptomyces spongiicola]GBQ03932.1 hypothetical protein SSP531S_54110 [Streptomyces spongiicola]
MLPPNLTRHFYETRRTFLKNATGQESTPWFQLSAMERSVAESEVEIFRQAIRAAEEEQDLLASLDKTAEASRAGTESTADAGADSPPENCGCPGCSAVAALLALLEPLDASTPSVMGLADVTNFPSMPLSFDARPISVDLSKLFPRRSPFDVYRAEFWTRKPPTADKA